MEKFLKKFKKDKRMQIVAGVIVVAIIGIIIISKVTSKSANQGTNQVKNNQKTQEKYSSEFPDLSNKQKPINQQEVSPLSGLKCQNPENKDRRPIAVMLASDTSVRPLSGVGEADMVFEMPVITASITRLMAVFICNEPEEIGSIRSARHDYITLAKGIDAILAHWGGSHFALEMLKNEDTVPNLDALNNEGGAFFRKAGIPAPDNGFASYEGLRKAADSLGYRLENHFEGYPHRQESPLDQRGKGGELTVGYPGKFKVEYTYDPKTNSYLRFWGGQRATDRNNNEQVAPKNVVVMFATSRQIEGQYNDVDVEGEGEMHAYIEGKEIVGTWEKKKGNCVIGNELVCVNSAKLKFLNENGEEIKFIPGQLWIQVLEPGQKLKWVPIGTSGMDQATQTQNGSDSAGVSNSVNVNKY
ncbi:MAG: DUF3048 domain-containing protein [Candidatus Moranbacteria bacterium]|nr:DUF3048 domain-containing protein [Candidatus Moranbacteria bacterium]